MIRSKVWLKAGLSGFECTRGRQGKGEGLLLPYSPPFAPSPVIPARPSPPLAARSASSCSPPIALPPLPSPFPFLTSRSAHTSSVYLCQRTPPWYCPALLATALPLTALPSLPDPSPLSHQWVSAHILRVLEPALGHALQVGAVDEEEAANLKEQQGDQQQQQQHEGGQSIRV